MTFLNEIDLHDAVLKKMEIDVVNKTVVLSIDYYESADDTGRTSCRCCSTRCLLCPISLT